MGRAVSKSFSPSVIIPGGAVMENKYVTWSRHGGPLMLLAVPCTG